MKKDRLFIGVYPACIVYADRETIEDGDYRRLAILPYRTLTLEWSENVPPELSERITADAAEMIARKGEPFVIAGDGKCVVLGT